jgi:beta-glucosidase/6-phospho-beta-glucosidase/beta-galactosidase
MRKFCHKYSSKFILYVITLAIFMSCMQKHKFERNKIELSDQKMTTILVDMLLMEAYVSEKQPYINLDSLTILKKSFYKTILKKHKVDSASFYSTFNYYQSHPKEFSPILVMVDSSLNKIIPKDTTFVKPVVEPPKNLESMASFTEQEKAMREAFIKNNDTLNQSSSKIGNRLRKNK